MNEEAILKKQEKHGKQLDSAISILQKHDLKFDAILSTLKKHDERLDQHDIQLSNIVVKLLDHDQQFVAIRGEMSEFKNEVLSGQDKMIVILKRLDEERVYDHKKIEENTKDIKQIKTLLKMA